MTSERLNHMMILHVHKHLTDQLDLSRMLQNLFLVMKGGSDALEQSNCSKSTVFNLCDVFTVMKILMFV